MEVLSGAGENKAESVEVAETWLSATDHFRLEVTSQSYSYRHGPTSRMVGCGVFFVRMEGLACRESVNQGLTRI